MDSVVLTSAERKALLTLKSTSELQARAQGRLATGLKINGAVDGPESYFQSKSLSDRTQDFLERMDDIEQGISLVVAAQTALDGVTTILQQMKGLVEASAVPSSADPDQFDEMLKQLNLLVDDAYYQGTNLLQNNSSAGEDVTTTTHTVEFSEIDNSQVDIEGEFAGSTYYMSTGGDSKLIPDSEGSSLSVSGTSTTQVATESAETRVNTTTTGNQSQAQVAALDDGGHVVVWQDDSGANIDIYAQLYDASGNAVGSEFIVNSTVTADQANPSVTTLSNGNFVVTWDDASGLDGGGDGLVGQIFTSGGVASGSEFVINTTNFGGAQDTSHISALEDGGFVVSWEDASGVDTSSSGIFANKFDSTGTSVTGEFQVNTTVSGDQINARTASLSDGGFIVVWEDVGGADTSGRGVFAQRYDSDGNASGSEFQVNTTITGNQATPDITGLSNGGFVVTWYEEPTQDIYVQVYDADGNKSGSEFQANTNAGNQAGPEVIETGDGGFLLTWVDYDADSSNGAIVGRRYDAGGTAISDEFQINTVTTGTQDHPKMATLSNGDFVVTWTDSAQDGNGDGIYSRRFSLGLTGGSVSGTSVTSTDYDNNQVTVDLGGVTQTVTITKQGLGVANAWYYQDFDTSEGRAEALSDLNDALDTVRTLSSKLGNQVSLLQVRADFTDKYTGHLKEGADKLILADINEEGANLLALQTRQSLGMQALGFLGNAVSNIIGLFR